MKERRQIASYSAIKFEVVRETVIRRYYDHESCQQLFMTIEI